MTNLKGNENDLFCYVIRGDQVEVSGYDFIVIYQVFSLKHHNRISRISSRINVYALILSLM